MKNFTWLRITNNSWNIRKIIIVFSLILLFVSYGSAQSNPSDSSPPSAPIRPTFNELQANMIIMQTLAGVWIDGNSDAVEYILNSNGTGEVLLYQGNEIVKKDTFLWRANDSLFGFEFGYGAPMQIRPYIFDSKTQVIIFPPESQYDPQSGNTYHDPYGRRMIKKPLQ